MQPAARIITTKPKRKTINIGPEDAGRWMTIEDYQAVREQEGYDYELIDGRLVVLPPPAPDHADVNDWLFELLYEYRSERPEVINRVTCRGAVFIPGRSGLTVPEP